MSSLTYRSARAKVQEALEAALTTAEANASASATSDTAQTNALHLTLYLALPPCICSLVYLISLTVNTLPGFYPGLIVTILLLLLGLAINLYVLHLVSKTEEGEVRREIETIMADYKVFLDTSEESAKRHGTSNSSSSGGAPAEIVSGHPHVSVVTAFRNMHWQRIPVLLLAEGDIIALMGGDITPGLVHELVPVAPNDTPTITGIPPSQSWKRGALIERGVKIYLRKNGGGGSMDSPSTSTPFSAASGISEEQGSPSPRPPPPSTQLPSYERHRSLASDSVELLILSGDIRCFQMAETPIGSFCQSLLQRNHSSYESRRKSLSALFPLFTPKPPVVMPGDNSVQFDLNAQEPLLRHLFYMIIKRGMQLMLLTIALFLLCAIIRLSLEPDSRFYWSQSVAVPVATIAACFLPASLPLILLLGEALMTADILATTEVVLFGEVEAGGEGAVTADHSQHNTLSRQNTMQGAKQGSLPNNHDRDEDEFSDDDEFLDEDIDERAEETAVEASTKIRFWRFIQYVMHVLKSRLRSGRRISDEKKPMYGPTHLDSSSSFPFSSPMLPVPLAKTRLVEVLGAVTMVCFVDDDIICEGYSVTEEIFLLHSDDKEAGRAIGTVLDLHANPEATGSRFEDPLWWKHLPSLKPIGLNALLTYAPMAPTPVIFKNLPENPIDYAHHTAAAGRILGKGLVRPASITIGKKKERFGLNYMEKSLVGHIRKSIPLENLRELAEEIGFVKTDVDCFSRLLEMNVMAPGLGDVRLVEDAHAWGQEETRRRGSLTSQVRGAVVKDTRGGGLQMMSQGDPSLVLNYCREYWDGSSITPLTAADRKEVLAVYDRWDLEDFDVVAFAYSPVPVNLQPLIFQAHGDSNKVGEINGDDLLNGLCMSDIQTNCLFFVDPRTATDLECFQNNNNSALKVKVGSGNKSSIKAVDQAEHQLLGAGGDIEGETEHQTAQHGSDEGDMVGLDLEGEGDFHGEDGGEGEGEGEGESYEEAIGNYAIDASLIGGIEGEAEDQGLFAADNTDGDVYSLMEAENFEIRGREVEEDEEDEERSRSKNNAKKESRPVPLLTTPTSPSGSMKFTMEPSPRSQTRRTLSDSNLLIAGSPSPTGTPRKAKKIVATYESTEGSSHDLSELLNDMAMQDFEQELYEASFANGPRSQEELLSIGSGIDIDTTSDAREERGALRQLADKDASKALDSLRKDNSLRLRGQSAEHGPGSEEVDGDHDDNMTSSTSNTASTCGTARLQITMPLAKSISLDAALSNRALRLSPVIEGGGEFEDTIVPGAAGGEACSVGALEEGGTPGRRGGGSFHIDASSGGSNPRRTNSAAAESKEAGESRGGGLSREEKKRRLMLIEQRRNSRRVTRSIGASLWHLLRQQVFLGMTASSVPIRPEVPNLMEDLTSAGVRFIYFSARNMRRSKPVAEKIGIQFDWNCAISLRDLQTEDEHDPHRYISNYADWDVHARMPHGIDAIKNHLRVVDNVPLLVSLYTDATPATTRQMVEVFREYGEVIMTVGSAYRAHNQDIFDVSNIALSVGVLPGKEGQIPSTVDEVLVGFSDLGDECLSKSDLLLTFRLVGLGSTPLLQMPANASIVRTAKGDGGEHENDVEIPFSLDMLMGEAGAVATPQMRLSALLEAIRQGRVFLLNMMQALAMLCVAVVSLGFWPLVSNAVPLVIPPSLPPCIAMLFIFVYLPIILLSMLHSPAPVGVLKNTPRKNLVNIRRGDEARFVCYLLIRAGYVAVSVFVIGWLTTTHKPSDTKQTPQEFESGAFSTGSMSPVNLAQFWLVQDTMSCEMLLSLLAQALTLIERGQKLRSFPNPLSHGYFYLGAAATLAIHAAVMVVRANFRLGDAGGVSSSDGGFQQYRDLDFVVWILMVAMPVIGVAIGLALAADDDVGYRRVLHFLRLEYDTRLGMVRIAPPPLTLTLTLTDGKDRSSPINHHPTEH